jgi:oxalate decarboxylase
MVTSHLFHLGQIQPQKVTEGGERVRAAKSNFPVLQGMSCYRLLLKKNAIREPHWHANADELGYCLKGKVLVSIYANGNVKETFLVNQGEVFFVPSGTLHGIENVNDGNSELVLQFSNEEPEDFNLSSMVGMFSDAVLGNTWNLSNQVMHSLNRSTKDVFITMRKDPFTIPKDANYTSPYRYNLEGSSPLVLNENGSAKVARNNVWPILKRQAVYSLELKGTGMREPHWHPETAELGFVRKGKGRMSILSPSEEVDTYEMNEGDIYFIPKAYPHHIENLTNDSLQIVIFFDQSMPGDIGLTASAKSYSDDVLTSVFNSPKDFFAKLPTYYLDLFIVKKVNPVDK